jgi:hypothetical protein
LRLNTGVQTDPNRGIPSHTLDKIIEFFSDLWVVQIPSGTLSFFDSVARWCQIGANFLRFPGSNPGTNGLDLDAQSVRQKPAGSSDAVRKFPFETRRDARASNLPRSRVQGWPANRSEGVTVSL